MLEHAAVSGADSEVGKVDRVEGVVGALHTDTLLHHTVLHPLGQGRCRLHRSSSLVSFYWPWLQSLSPQSWPRRLCAGWQSNANTQAWSLKHDRDHFRKFCPPVWV